MKNILSLFLSLVALVVFIPSGQTACDAEFEWSQIASSYNVEFFNTSTSDDDIISFHWNFGDGHESDGENPTHEYDEPGVYLVCLIIENSEGCISDVCHEVVVEGIQSECEANFEWDQITGTYTIEFFNTSTSDDDIISFLWNFGDGHESDGENPTHEYDEPGVYLVCLIIENSEGCISDVCHEVVVEGIQSECEATFEWDQITGTYTIEFFNTSTSDDDIISFHWNFGDGHVGDGENPTHEYDEPGVYLVCLIIENSEGCISDVCHEVVVEGIQSECEANFEWEQIGGTYTIEFFNTSTSDDDIISFHWNFGDGHVGDGENPTHEYDEPGVYLVCLIIENSEGCISDVCHEVVVEGIDPGECNAEFNWEQLTNSLEIHFHSTSTGEQGIESYHWDFGDGHFGDGVNPYHTYEEPGTYLVCLTIETETGCTDSICYEVVVEPLEDGCNASFEWDQIPGTFNIHFINHSTSDQDIISYLWIFGDGHQGDGQNPTHEYEGPGEYTVCLIIETEGGCVSEFCQQVIVEEIPAGCHALFEWEQISGTLNIHFINQSFSDHDIISYLWIFGDGHQGDGHSPTHEYDEPGTYLVCLIITDNTGCESEICHEVVVEGIEDCHAQFEWSFIEGTLGVEFINQSTSTHDIISYLWTFGDGHSSTEQNPTHTYDEPGGYLVCLRIEDNTGCVSEVCHDFYVHGPEECEAHFNFEIDNDDVVHFNNTSTGATNHTTWLWEFGDGETSTEENPIHEYEDLGIYTICLTMTDTSTDCMDEFCLSLALGMSWEDIHHDAIPEHSQTSAAPVALNEDFILHHYTNPVSDHLNINYEVRKENTLRFAIYDLTGNRMVEKSVPNQKSGQWQERLDIGIIHPGLYILTVSGGETQCVIKFSVSR